MSHRFDRHIPEEHYVSKAWLTNYLSPDIPGADHSQIINPFDFGPSSTCADPKLSPPPFSYDKFKHWLALLDQEQTIRFEVNLKLFNEIVNHIVHDSKPKFTLINERTLVYNEYDRIPIIFIPGQKEPLKIIKKKEKA